MKHTTFLQLAGFLMWTALTGNCQAEQTVAVSSVADTIRVPDDHVLIQSAIDAAKEGDTVLVAPGIYHEALRLSGKSIKLCSHYSQSKDISDIHQTVLDGSLPRDEVLDEERRRDQVILIDPDVGADTIIEGFTIRDGDDGIACYAKVNIINNRFVNNVDGIDYEGGGGICKNNVFVANDDDGIDLDQACEAKVVDNEIRDNDDDGIEIRLHEYNGPQLKIVILRNEITGNGEDGIQIIDYPDHSDRSIRIERNLIANNAMAGIGLMSNGNTVEDYQGAPIPERVEVINNTIANSQYGVTGGANTLLINNLIVSNLQAGLKRVQGHSEISHCLFWENNEDVMSCNPAQSLIIDRDPKLSPAFYPAEGSPCIGSGITNYSTKSGDRVSTIDVESEGSGTNIGALDPHAKL